MEWKSALEITLAKKDYLLGGVVRGGFNHTVYLARCLGDGGDRYVHLSDPIESGRRKISLLRQARSIAGLLEESDLEVDYGLMDFDMGTRFFMVEEIKGGAPLRDLVDREKRIPSDRAADIVLQVLDELSRAHDRGILHLAVDLNSIVITGEAGAEKARLINYQPWKGRLTVSNHFPRYERRFEAPELSMGLLGTMADVYGAGRVLYECLVGIPPRTVLPPISLYPDIPVDLARVVEQAVEQFENDRFQSPREFAHSLRDAKLNSKQRLGNSLASVFSESESMAQIWVIDGTGIDDAVVETLSSIEGASVTSLPGDERETLVSSLRSGSVEPPELVVFGEDNLEAEEELLAFLRKNGVNRLIIKPEGKKAETKGYDGPTALTTSSDTHAVTSAVREMISRSRSHLVTSVKPWSERPFPVPL